MKQEKKKKLPDVRKGCKFCKQPLRTFKERALRICDECAKETLTSFNKISEGKIKEGYNEIKDKVFGTDINKKKLMDAKVGKTISNKDKKIIRMAKKRGISEEQTKASLDIFKEARK